MSQESASTGLTGAYETRGNYRTNMTALGVRPGLLKATSGLAMDRLTFVADNGEVLVDAPISQLHSVGLAEMNRTLEFWDGDKRHRISLAPEGVLMGNIVGEFQSNSLATQWYDYLVPLVGSPPQGVKVKKPLSRGATIGLAFPIAFAVLVVVIIAVAMLA